ncbi:Murein DD-endopeptidase MepM and murein hydrolase activator NlpD, contain LysM domain [Bosea sp. OK403]|uniref:peptidoglycan DD-metalloendopeptidase family protein n=1 Tax=Bosea sp. OK403 TaxID=1855286 RepID=UPI0008EF591F|nr:peptidoglycan DD-metalloendopeptidase family protein [Bosea sp. OK403]SFJ79450.1 Murein DD-endopeptidase MepM and murein hydrolase activator NlpD, contain LysM domain [Bosea sp. OK403]
MRIQVGSVQPSVVLRVSTVCLLALGVSACSSETMRFSDAPFSSPFKSAQAAPPMRDPATTGSIGRVASTPLNPPSAPAMASVRSQPLPPPQSAVALRNSAPSPTGGSASGWSAQGGTPIVVAQGETLDMISSRYGVPRAALISANGLSGPTIAPGSRLTIPVYNANAGSVPAVRQQFAQSAQVQSDARPEPARNLAPPTAPPTAPAARIAAPAMPASAPARAKAVAEAKASAAAESKATEAAQAKSKAATDAQAMRESRAKFAAEAKAKAEARKTPVAAVPVAPVANVPAAKPVVAEVKKPAPEKAKPVVVASAPAVEPKVTAVPKAAPEPVVTASLPKQAAEEDASDKADFRWPARGRVISGYSGKGGNEGINIAVPEGTPVKAAEGGTVAYAGSELKGYGNLVLIRHPNGYVSAYAHNGDLKVKRGDTVKRGQVVANSGQSGNVSSPQLHFELRKGSSPVDPTPYLTN